MCNPAPAHRPQDRRAAAERAASEYGVSKGYVLTVGTVGPHKNLITLVEAMKILREHGELPFQLLLAATNCRFHIGRNLCVDSGGPGAGRAGNGSPRPPRVRSSFEKPLNDLKR